MGLPSSLCTPLLLLLLLLLLISQALDCFPDSSQLPVITTKVVELCPPGPPQVSALLILASQCPLHDFNVLEQRRIDVEPHLDAELLDDVAEHN